MYTFNHKNYIIILYLKYVYILFSVEIVFRNFETFPLYWHSLFENITNFNIIKSNITLNILFNLPNENSGTSMSCQNVELGSIFFYQLNSHSVRVLCTVLKSEKNKERW